MKFNEAWSSVATQNSNFKFVILCLSVVASAAIFIAIKLSAKNPIVIERNTTSKVLLQASNERISSEIIAFISEALAQRFDSASEEASYLSEVQDKTKVKEFEDLKKKGLSQRVVINNIELKDSFILVDADRIIGAGKVKSIFPFKLKAFLKETKRSQRNPYGLILEHVESQESNVERTANESTK